MSDERYEFVPREDYDLAMRALRCALDESDRLRDRLRWAEDANRQLTETAKRLAKEVPDGDEG